MWVEFCARGVEASANATWRRIERLIEWQQQAFQTVRAAGIRGVGERLTGELIGNPVVRAPIVAANHGISAQGAPRALRRLSELGLVVERQRGGRVSFAAAGVVEILSD